MYSSPAAFITASSILFGVLQKIAKFPGTFSRISSRVAILELQISTSNLKIEFKLTKNLNTYIYI